MRDSIKSCASLVSDHFLEIGCSRDVAIFIAAMSILETDSYYSDICFENCNLFGMKYATIRPTTAVGVNRLHASYPDYLASLNDFSLYLAYYHFTQDILTDLEKFKTRLVAKHYSEVPDYIQRVEAIYNQLINP